MVLSLNEIQGEVDKRGRVTLDVASDVGMTCTLGGMPGVQKVVAAFIQSRLAALPMDQRIFELGLFDFSGNNPLSPTSFVIRTMKLPGSADDGAVLVFIRLNINDKNGSMPVEGGDFPYLIPDDLAVGKSLYSASLVLNKELIELLDEVQLDVLKNLLLPGANIFFESPGGRHTPHDLLVLGKLKETEASVSIVPPYINLKAGKTQAFTARKSDGAAVSAKWIANNPVNPLSTGSITPTGGVYTAPAPSQMGKNQQPIVISAQYAMGGEQQTRTALVLGVFESMNISPLVCTSGVGPGAGAVQLTASTLSGGALQWPTLDPSDGRLQIIDNNHAIYTPPSIPKASIALQKIVVTDASTKETIEATIVLISGPHNLPIDPPYVESVSASEPIQIYSGLPAEFAEWTVIGEGEVDDNGLFTPPASATSRISVVECSYVAGGIPLASGFCIVQFTERQGADPVWSELQEFSIVANGDRCFSNGIQQIPVTITISTKSVNVGGQEVFIPVSDAQLSTLRLVDKFSGEQIPFVHVAQDGIEYNSKETRAVSKRRNRFRLYPSAAATSDPTELPTPQNNGVRYRQLWIHLAREGLHTFYAQINTDHGTFRSLEYGNDYKEVAVHGIRPPTPALAHYELRRERASQDPDGYDYNPGDGTELDKFSMYRFSVDYWRLSYLRSGNYPVLFSTSRVAGNISTVQWEADLTEEENFSYTGCAFKATHFENSDSPAPEGLSFDPFLWGLMRLRGKRLDTAFVKDKEPSPGELVVSLHRTDDVKYWYDGLANGDKRKLYRQHLDPAVRFQLLDEEGNRHSLSVGFESWTQKDSRNKLIVKPV